MSGWNIYIYIFIRVSSVYIYGNPIYGMTKYRKHKWALILATACLPPAFHFFEIILPIINYFKLMQTDFSCRPFCIPGCNGLKSKSEMVFFSKSGNAWKKLIKHVLNFNSLDTEWNIQTDKLPPTNLQILTDFVAILNLISRIQDCKRN